MKLKSHIHIFILPICILGIMSCSSVRVRRPRKDIPQKYEKYVMTTEYVPISEHEGYLNRYIVDTIQIDTPVVIVTSHWQRMVMPYSVYSDFRGSEKDLYKKENVFFYDNCRTGDGFPRYTDYNIISKNPHPAYDITIKTCPFPVCQLPKPKARCIEKAYISERQHVDFYLVLITKQNFFGLFFDILHGDVYPELQCNDADFIRLLVPACRE